MPIRNAPIRKLEKWKPGDRLLADKLNQPIDAINSMARGVRPGVGAHRLPRVVGRQLQITAIENDHLTCNPYDGNADTTTEIRVAKPSLLRHVAAHNGITYQYRSDGTREANNGSSTEIQALVPAYVVGDVIYALANFAGGTNVTHGGGNVPAVWLVRVQ